jgi:hypothetical protein
MLSYYGPQILDSNESMPILLFNYELMVRCLGYNECSLYIGLIIQYSYIAITDNTITVNK